MGHILKFLCSKLSFNTNSFLDASQVLEHRSNIDVQDTIRNTNKKHGTIAKNLVHASRFIVSKTSRMMC